MNYKLISLQNRLARSEERKKELLEWKFMGGIFGLIIFLFISMGLGIIVWIITAFANQRELGRIDTEIYSLRSMIASESSASENEIVKMRDEIEELKLQLGK